jgi:hypothetical protein
MRPIPIAQLPSSKVILAMLELWEKYQNACASSHWRDLGPQSEIRIEDYAIAALHGSGFGDCQNRSILGISRLFHFATILSYLSILPKRANILSWMADAHKLLKSLYDLDMFFSYDVFRQCCIASLLEPYIANRTNPKILLIGDASHRGWIWHSSRPFKDQIF